MREGLAFWISLCLDIWIGHVLNSMSWRVAVWLMSVASGFHVPWFPGCWSDDPWESVIPSAPGLAPLRTWLGCQGDPSEDMDMAPRQPLRLRIPGPWLISPFLHWPAKSEDPTELSLPSCRICKPRLHIWLTSWDQWLIRLAILPTTNSSWLEFDQPRFTILHIFPLACFTGSSPVDPHRVGEMLLKITSGHVKTLLSPPAAVGWSKPSWQSRSIRGESHFHRVASPWSPERGRSSGAESEVDPPLEVKGVTARRRDWCLQPLARLNGVNWGMLPPARWRLEQNELDRGMFGSINHGCMKTYPKNMRYTSLVQGRRFASFRSPESGNIAKRMISAHTSVPG